MSACFVIAVASCGGGNCPVPTGAEFALTRTEVAAGSNNCPADVASTLAAMPQTIQLGEDNACGSAELPISTSFTLTSGLDCEALEILVINDLEPSGGSGSDDAEITCNDGTQCTQDYEVDLTST